LLFKECAAQRVEELLLTEQAVALDGRPIEAREATEAAIGFHARRGRKSSGHGSGFDEECETVAGEIVAGPKRNRSGRERTASLGCPSVDRIRRSLATLAMPKPYFH